jgi:hypothetical protein
MDFSKIRFTTARIRKLHEDHGIDLMSLKGPELVDPASRVKITVAGMGDAPADEVGKACDELTPGEHIELLGDAIRVALMGPAALKQEAEAKAAATTKSPA